MCIWLHQPCMLQVAYTRKHSSQTENPPETNSADVIHYFAQKKNVKKHIVACAIQPPQITVKWEDANRKETRTFICKK